MDANHCEIADALAVRGGFAAIGYNWELLDPSGDAGAPRSAVGILVQALACDMEFPQTQWLGEQGGHDCARDFLALFDRPTATIVSNRLTDFWNPLTRARIEWAFVGYDATRIVMLVLARD